MSDEERYAKALAFAAKKHEGQYRVGGLPYITHPVAVANDLRAHGYGIDYQITGLFHDLLEDTDATVSEITALGGDAVADAVQLLTKKDGYIMAEYIAGIRSNPMAMAVKAADRLHNLQSAFVTTQSFRRRYILETLDWYMDFSPEIPKAVEALIRSLDRPMPELPPEYQSLVPNNPLTTPDGDEKGRIL